MKKKISVIVGGTRGIGSVISTTLKKRGDKLLIFSRNAKKKLNNFKIDLLKKNEINQFFNNKFSKAKVDNLVFSHRYRGKNANEDFQVSLHAVEQIIELMKNKMSKKASIVIINSIAIKTIVDDQPQRYHVIRGGLEQLTKYSATINNPYNCIYELEKAIYFAQEGRKGPVWIEVPLDVQSFQIKDKEN